MSNHPWASAPQELTLPSGAVVKVRPVRMHALIRDPSIAPDLLLTLAGETEDVREQARVMALVAERALIEPRVTSDPKKVNEAKGVYSVDSIPDGDFPAIFAWSQGADLASFRDKSARPGAGEDGAVLGDDAERDDAPVAA